MRKKNQSFNFQTLTSKTGFTVVELLVSIGVFAVILAIIVNTFISSLRTQRALLGLMLANDNVSLAIEQMSREMRTGFNFLIEDTANSNLCANAPANTSATEGIAITFCNANNEIVTYKFNNEAIERRGSYAGGFSPITGKNVKVDNLTFRRVIPDASADWPPRINITLKVGSKNIELKNIFTNIQTTISGRNI